VTNLTGPAATNWSDYLYWDTTVTPNSWQVGTNQVHLGSNAGSTSQGNFSVAVGNQAGQSSQGNNSIAIGYRAGLTNQHPSTLILNATGSALNSATQNACYIAPIRLASTSTVLYYNSTTKEVLYGAAPSGGGGATISTFNTLCVSSLGVGTIKECVTVSTTLPSITPTPIVYNSPGSYNVSVPCGTTSISFEMIGAGGAGVAINPALYGGRPGGYISGYFTVPVGVTSVDIIVGTVGDGSSTPSGASYIKTTGNSGPLFVMAGAGGSGESGFTVISGGEGGGGYVPGGSGIANGGNGSGGNIGTQGGGGGTAVGGTAGIGCSGDPGAAGAGRPSPETFTEALGGTAVITNPGGSGYTGGGSGCGGGGGSSYVHPTYTYVSTSYAGNSVPAGVLSGTFGRPGNSGYVSITFNTGCGDGISLRTNGDIVTRNVYTSSVQIGITGSPVAFPLEINQTGSVSTFTAGYLYNSSGIQSSITTGTINMRTVSGIWAANFYASSDQRIKTNIKDINDDQALQVVRGLQPVCYNYIDPIRHHNQLEYGFIAQQVKSLLPHAVRTETEFVPNIYDLADFSALGSDATMVTLRHRTVEHIQVNDVVKILDLKEKPLMYSVTDVNYNYFTIDVNLSTIVSEYTLTEEDVKNGIQKNTVFVYGTRVDDFHVLDKHAIYSVSIGALQEMDRTIQRQALRILDLETRQEARLKDLEDKLGVLTMEKPMTSSVSDC
jgi:hypothetical protein